MVPNCCGIDGLTFADPTRRRQLPSVGALPLDTAPQCLPVPYLLDLLPSLSRGKDRTRGFCWARNSCQVSLILACAVLSHCFPLAPAFLTKSRGLPTFPRPFWNSHCS